MELDLNSITSDPAMEVDPSTATQNANGDGGGSRNEVGGEEIVVEDLAGDEDELEDEDDDVIEFVPIDVGDEGGENVVETGGEVNVEEENIEENIVGNEENDVVGVVAAPAVGMVFSSMEEEEQYYKRYGKQEGFGVVKRGGSSYVGRDGVRKPLRNSTWTCDRFGRPDRRRRVKGKRFVTDAQVADGRTVTSSKKCECTATIYAGVNDDNAWELKRAVNEHRNHKLSAKNSVHIAQHRKEELTSHMKRKIRVGFASGLSVAQLYNMLLSERNGYVALTRRDERNELGKDKKLKLKDGDAEAMIKYFSKMTADNQIFSCISARLNRANARHIVGRC